MHGGTCPSTLAVGRPTTPAPLPAVQLWLLLGQVQSVYGLAGLGAQHEPAQLDITGLEGF